MKKLIFYFFVLFSTCICAQVGINTTTPNAQLDIRSSNQTSPANTDGLLIPKVDNFPSTNPSATQQGILVYLTTNVGSNPPGFYYWNNSTTSWIPIKGNDTGTLDQAYDFGGAGNGRNITADAGAVLINGTDGLVSTGTMGSGALAPSGAGTRMVWNPRKAAFRVGQTTGTGWDDANVGIFSTAFGFNAIASGIFSTAFGGNTIASGATSTAFGSTTTASGFRSTAFGFENSSSSHGETVIGIGATTYILSTNGATQFRTANAGDRLFVIGNAIDSNNNGLVDTAERSDAVIVLKNGLTRLPSTTNTMIDAADGKAVVTKEYLQSSTSGTLDQAYDFGGAGNGKTITADAGAVIIDGTDGFVSTGTSGSGVFAPAGAGTKMFWNPRKASLRAGRVDGTRWDDNNIGLNSVAFGINTMASGEHSTAFGNGSSAEGFISTAFGNSARAEGSSSTAFGNLTLAIGSNSTAFGNGTEASGFFSTAFGDSTTASNFYSTAFGQSTTASGNVSTAFGLRNSARSFGETVIGIGATNYTLSVSGANQFRSANSTDRLFVIGNAIDANNNNTVDDAERRDAMVVLKSGNIGIGISSPQERLHVAGRTFLTDGFSADNAALLYRNNTDYMFIGPQSGSSANGAAIALFGSTNASGSNAGGLDINVPNALVRMNHNNGNFTFGTNSTSGYTGVFELNDNGMEIGHNSASRAILFNPNSTERMRLTPAGNLGVGTNNPLQKVHVSGPAGLTAVRIANTSGIGSTSNVALDFFRNTAANTDWRIYNIGANLTIGNSGDDLTTVNDLYQYQGVRFMPMNDATQNLGQAANRWNTLFASNGTINTSDAREKKNIQNLQYGLNALMQLHPVSFEWKKNDGSGTKLGLIAQELRQVIPEVVRDWDWEEDEQGNRKKVASPILGVYYSDLIPVLIKATQEQQFVIEQQKQEIDLLKQQLQEQYKLLLERIEKLEKDK